MPVDTTPAEDFFNTLAEAAVALRRDTSEGYRRRFELPVYQTDDNRLDTPWQAAGAVGLAKAAANHAEVLGKLRFGASTRHELQFDYCFAEVSTGVLLTAWYENDDTLSSCSRRQGFGILPYFRYSSEDFPATTYFDKNDVPVWPTVPFQPYWNPDLEKFIVCTGLNAEMQEALRQVVRSVFAIEPAIIGWVEGDPTQMVWSVGDAAKRTILAAEEARRAKDVFHAAKAFTLTVRSYSPGR